jgi:hypothetical protein
MNTGLARHLPALAQKVNPSAPSVPKWHPVRNLLAEALGVPENDVYVTTVSKAGNLRVRVEQSDDARNAKILVGMYTGGVDLESTLESMKARCKRGKRLGLIVDRSANWRVIAIVKHRGTAVPSVLASEYPGASVNDI